MPAQPSLRAISLASPQARRADDRLLAELAAPPSVSDAREALAFWQRRLESLPARRRADRREAAEMVQRWRVRVRDAERAHYGPRLRDPLHDLAVAARGAALKWLAGALKAALVMMVLMTVLVVIAAVVLWPEIHGALQLLTAG